MDEEPLDQITEAALVLAALTPLTASTAKKFLEELLAAGFDIDEAKLICRRGGHYVARSIVAMQEMRSDLEREDDI